MYLTRLYPQPRSVKEDNSIRYTFGARATLHLSRAVAPLVAERMKYLWQRFCCTACELEICVHGESGAGFSAWLGERCGFTSAYYSIRSDARGVNLAAVSEKALVEGFATLVQLICPVELDYGAEEFYIAAAEIDDSPAIKIRSIHLCIFPNSDISTLEKAIHLAGFLKMTHVVLEFWGVLELEVCRELAWEGCSWSKEKAKILVDLAKSYGMEVIPMFNHIGHAAASRSCYGRHVVLNKNLRLSKLFEPDGWTWCSTNPKTFALLKEVRHELIELCGEGEYFHLGADESYSFATCDKCRERVPAELLAEWMNSLADDLAKQGRRPIMWHDQLIDRKSFTCNDWIEANGQDNQTSAALELLDRRIIIADWQYHYVSGENPTTPYFMEKGFDTLLCPWDSIANIRSLCKNANDLGAYGVMLTTWDRLPKYIGNFLVTGDIAWQNERPIVGQRYRTENAALLRKLYDTDGNFDISGWNNNEVEQ